MSTTIRPIKPEIMSPAGYWPQAQAAIEAGADAIYFGLRHFTARAKVGFGLDELPELMGLLHSRGLKGYLTFNTLIFEHELAAAARTLAAIAEAGTDAIIVQDVGIAQLARQIAPALDIHGSTQMSITSAEGVELARRFGVSRVVLARELALPDIRSIRAQTDCELELFVHGALCVSYSGQCFSSEAWGGRSANRGQCAQACRLPYELLVDGLLKPLGDARYLLSPGDLFALHQIPAIIQIGIHALKIEGRYKDADYVALTTRAYRRAVDEAWAGLPLSLTRADELQLEQVYSRGLGAFFIAGTNHQQLVSGRAPRHRGVLAGRVTRVLPDAIVVAPEPDLAAHAPLKPGDGVVFDAADWRSPEEKEEGGRIFELKPLHDGQLELRFGRRALDPARIRPGDLLWRTHDPEIDRLARPFTEAQAPIARQLVDVQVLAHEGAPLELRWSLAADPSLGVSLRSPEALPQAQKQALSLGFLREQLGRLGGTAYSLGKLAADIQGQPFVPGSLLNSLRRQAVEALAALQTQPRPRTLADPLLALDAALAAPAQLAIEAESSPEQRNQAAQAQLHLLVRNAAQLEAALEVRPASITLDYLELYGLKPAVERIYEHGIVPRVASPRVLKPGEQRVVRFLLKLGCAILVRSSGLLQALRDTPQTDLPELIGDFSLNAANTLSAEAFLRLGLARLTPTHDLNAAQVAELARGIGPRHLEAIAYQHLPVFHTEHCVFCRFLSSGTSYKDCGHPCEQHRVALRDQQGRAHPVMADVGCRNTVFGAEAQEASRHLEAWRAAGIRHLRLEFVHETPAQLQLIVRDFAEHLVGRLPGPELTRQLQRLAPEGSTEGSLFVPESYLAIPLMQ